MKKKFSQRSSTTQRDADRERVNKMGDDIREEIQQLIREVAEPRDAEIAELRAENAAIKFENAQLRALASRLSSVEMFENICPIALPRDEGARDEGAHAKRARDEDTPVCVVLCGEEDCANGKLVELPCGHHIHTDCVLMLLIVNKKTLCPACRAPMAQSDYAKNKLRAYEEVENEMAQIRASRELAVALQATPHDDDDVQAQEQADMIAIMDSDDEDNRPINPNV